MQTKAQTLGTKIDTIKAPAGCGLKELSELIKKYYDVYPNKNCVYFKFCGVTEIIRREEISSLYNIYKEAYKKKYDKASKYISEEHANQIKRIHEFKEMWNKKGLKIHFKDENAEKGFSLSEEYAPKRQMNFIKLWIMIMQYKIEEEGSKLEDIAFKAEKEANIDSMSNYEFMESEEYIASIWKYGDEFEKWLKSL